MRHQRYISSLASRAFRSARAQAATTIALAMIGSSAVAQSPTPLLASRAELVASAVQAEQAATAGDPNKRAQNAITAAGIRQRLNDGDFQVGDRVVVTVVSDAVHRDTLVVKTGRVLELRGMADVPVAGVLRSELYDVVSTAILKYVKAQEIEVSPLVRVGILGAVTRPGYFAFASDLPLTDAIMSAGGPNAAADVDRSVVRRRNQQFRTSDETRKAIAGGLTLDQFGLSAGDELIIGQRSDFGAAKVLGMAGAFASVAALYLALRHR